MKNKEYEKRRKAFNEWLLSYKNEWLLSYKSEYDSKGKTTISLEQAMYLFLKKCFRRNMMKQNNRNRLLQYVYQIGYSAGYATGKIDGRPPVSDNGYNEEITDKQLEQMARDFEERFGQEREADEQAGKTKNGDKKKRPHDFHKAVRR